jgi:NAD-dependent dihydropyrimidine dehydrogenase PreA subunit
MFGAIVGARKRELHVYAPGVQDFSRVLADVLQLVPPGLTIMDGILGQEGSGPGAGGTPRQYDCLAASADPVALDTVITEALGYRQGEVLHLAQAAERRLGIADLDAIRVEAPGDLLDFGPVDLPTPRWYLRVPSWISAPLQGMIKLYPDLQAEACVGCGRCVEVCPRDAITPGQAPRTPPSFDLKECVGCMCCAEICPDGAIEPGRNLLARLIGLGG